MDPESPAPVPLTEAAGIVSAGGVVVFPTRCLYGLAADALNAEAVAKIFRVKRRPPDKPLLIIVKDMEALEAVARNVPPQARLLMETFWPGNLTVVLPARENLPRDLTGGTGKIGIRLPGHPVAMALAKLSKNPITGTSANLSGGPGCADIETLAPEILHDVDLVLDAGPLEGGTGSTVVDASGAEPIVLREGKITAARVLDALRRT